MITYEKLVQKCHNAFFFQLMLKLFFRVMYHIKHLLLHMG